MAKSATTNGGKPFLQITNQDIYNEILELKESVKEIVGIKKRVSWIGTLVIGAYGFTMAVLSFLISHLLNK